MASPINRNTPVEQIKTKQEQVSAGIPRDKLSTKRGQEVKRSRVTSGSSRSKKTTDRVGGAWAKEAKPEPAMSGAIDTKVAKEVSRALEHKSEPLKTAEAKLKDLEPIKADLQAAVEKKESLEARLKTAPTHQERVRIRNDIERKDIDIEVLKGVVALKEAQNMQEMLLKYKEQAKADKNEPMLANTIATLKHNEQNIRKLQISILDSADGLHQTSAKKRIQAGLTKAQGEFEVAKKNMLDNRGKPGFEEAEKKFHEANEKIRLYQERLSKPNTQDYVQHMAAKYGVAVDATSRKNFNFVKNVCKEILTTEKSYVEGLEHGRNTLEKITKKSKKGNAIFSQDAAKFNRHLEEAQRIQGEFKSENPSLQEVANYYRALLGSNYTETINDFVPAFTDIQKNMTEFDMKRVDSKMKPNEIKNFKQDLATDLIRPIQRVPRHVLLLGEIINKLPPGEEKAEFQKILADLQAKTTSLK